MICGNSMESCLSIIISSRDRDRISFDVLPGYFPAGARHLVPAERQPQRAGKQCGPTGTSTARRQWPGRLLFHTTNPKVAREQFAGFSQKPIP